MYQFQWPSFDAFEADLARLYGRQDALFQAINNAEAAYGHLMERFVALESRVVGNHLVKFQYRMTCTFAFAHGDASYAPTLIATLEGVANFAALSLDEGNYNNVEWALRRADLGMEQLGEYLRQLDEAIKAHEQVEEFLIARRILTEWRRPAVSKVQTDPQALSIVQLSEGSRRDRFERVRGILQRRVSKGRK